MQRQRRFTVGLGFAIATAGLARSALATEGALPLTIDVDPSSDVAAEDVRRAIATELGASVASSGDPVPANAGRIEVRSAGGVVRVTFHDARGRGIEREVTAPEKEAERLRVIGLLAGNLARNEAEEIVREEQPSAPASAPLPVPAPATVPRAAWTDVPPSRRGAALRIGGWITMGASLATGLGGVALGVAARNSIGSLQACAPSCGVSQLQNETNQLDAADALLLVGLVGTITGSVLVLAAPNPKTPVAITVTDHEVRFVARF
jgi:hypothetical protein